MGESSAKEFWERTLGRTVGESSVRERSGESSGRELWEDAVGDSSG